jgi:hypothetical protein
MLASGGCQQSVSRKQLPVLCSVAALLHAARVTRVEAECTGSRQSKLL